MNRSTILRGVSAGALTLVLFSAAADAQESLPTIDVGAARRTAPRGPKPSEGRAATTSIGPALSQPAQTTGGKIDPAKETGYARTTSYSATRTDTPLIDTPAAVQIVPHEVIQDKQILDTMEATKNVSGVQASPGTFYDAYLIRGFNNSHTWRNGLRLPEWLVGAEEVAFTDRVEVIKGPASVLYGRIEPGGFVNIVTKKPQEEFKASLEEQFGSWGLSRTVADVTGPANAEKTVLYRLMGAFDHRDSFVDFEHRDNGAVALFLTFRPTQNFEFNTQFEHYQKKQTPPSGDGTIPVYRQWDLNGKPLVIAGFNDRPVNLPRHFSASDPGIWNDFPFVVHRTLYNYDWTYKFDEKWKVSQRFQYLTNYENENFLANYNTPFDGVNIYRLFSQNGADRTALSTNLDLTGEVSTAFLTHKLLAGVDWYRAKIDYPGFGGGDAFIPPLNIFAPSYGYFTGVLHYLADTARGNMIYRTNWSDFGVYAQDQITAFDDRLHILIGGRWDKTYAAASKTYGAAYADCFPGCTGYPMGQFPDKPMLSPRAAVLFKLQDNVSVYGSYVRSLGANNGGMVSDGSHPPPEVGRQWEAGVKTQWLNDKLSASVAIFDLRKTNVLQPDPFNPGLSIAVGEVTSRGVEFDISGQVTENLSVIGSYTFDSVKITKDNNNGNAGKRYNGASPNVGNLWAKWDTAPGLAEGWEFGAGFYAMGQRYGSNDNAWKLPGYVKFDTMMAYRVPIEGHKVTFRFNIKNLTDRKYFEYSDGWAFANYGQPRTFVGSVNVQW